MTALAPSPPLLEMAGMEKSFPGVRALRHGALTLRAGEVHALVGENGAGKSTLIKILAGAHPPDAGEIRIDGRHVRIPSPRQSSRLGIAVIHQEFNLVPTLSVRENIFLGREPARAGWVLEGAERRELAELWVRLGLRMDPESLCATLSVAEQQLVEIAKALARQARILVMDEPTAALSEREVGRLLALVRELRAQGLGIIYVSHRLGEVLSLSDRITVMRDGELVATAPVADFTRERLIETMVGRKLEAEFPARSARPGPPRLVVRDLCRGRSVRGVSFEVGRGEVVGLAGLVGAGRTETVRLLFGADRADSGSVSVDGRSVRLRSPRDAIQAGLCLLTEDRKQEGLVLGLPVRENFGLPNLRTFSRAGFLRRGAERTACGGFVRTLGIRLAHVDQAAYQLSGGNQQKVVLAKWLQANAEVVIFDEPTRGVDVGAKFEIYQLINELAAAGKAVLMVSSELPEVLGMSDRILVMRAGRIAGEIRQAARATQAEVLHLATEGGVDNAGEGAGEASA
ncbi:MAG TPA: sugar ABC transporter ATP-binding protein [Candidatus Saccharimonadales bacterium]|nr:sugar ABC transporter ATP-binding protein [Candidatus Saccharimonadales bacterium]